jgi:hypothetical protein
LCSASVVAALAEQAQDNIKDRKNDLLQLYDALPIADGFADVDENEFYELYDKVSSYFFFGFLFLYFP